MVGIYINLDSDRERRVQLEQQLAALGLQESFRRCPGIVGATVPRGKSTISAGEIGCFRSHLAALRMARESGGPAQIVEDDVLLSRGYGRFAAGLATSKTFSSFDIVFTEVALQPEIAALHQLKLAIDGALGARAAGRPFELRFLDITRRSFSSAVSYFVSPQALDKLIRMVEHECLEGPRLPYDLFLRAAAQQGLLKIGCVIPYLTCVRLESLYTSNITSRVMQDGNPSVLALNLLRYAFFIDGDMGDYVRPFVEKVPSPYAPESADRRFDLVMRILGFMLSDRMAKF